MYMFIFQEFEALCAERAQHYLRDQQSLIQENHVELRRLSAKELYLHAKERSRQLLEDLEKQGLKEAEQQLKDAEISSQEQQLHQDNNDCLEDMMADSEKRSTAAEEAGDITRISSTSVDSKQFLEMIRESVRKNTAVLGRHPSEANNHEASSNNSPGSFNATFHPYDAIASSSNKMVDMVSLDSTASNNNNQQYNEDNSKQISKDENYFKQMQNQSNQLESSNERIAEQHNINEQVKVNRNQQHNQNGQKYQNSNYSSNKITNSSFLQQSSKTGISDSSCITNNAAALINKYYNRDRRSSSSYSSTQVNKENDYATNSKDKNGNVTCKNNKTTTNNTQILTEQTQNMNNNPHNTKVNLKSDASIEVLQIQAEQVPLQIISPNLISIPSSNGSNKSKQLSTADCMQQAKNIQGKVFTNAQHSTKQEQQKIIPPESNNNNNIKKNYYRTPNSTVTQQLSQKRQSIQLSYPNNSGVQKKQDKSPGKVPCGQNACISQDGSQQQNQLIGLRKSSYNEAFKQNSAFEVLKKIKYSKQSHKIDGTLQDQFTTGYPRKRAQSTIDMGDTFKNQFRQESTQQLEQNRRSLSEYQEQTTQILSGNNMKINRESQSLRINQSNNKHNISQKKIVDNKNVDRFRNQNTQINNKRITNQKNNTNSHDTGYWMRIETEISQNQESENTRIVTSNQRYRDHNTSTISNNSINTNNPCLSRLSDYTDQGRSTQHRSAECVLDDQDVSGILNKKDTSNISYSDSLRTSLERVQSSFKYLSLFENQQLIQAKQKEVQELESIVKKYYNQNNNNNLDNEQKNGKISISSVNSTLLQNISSSTIAIKDQFNDSSSCGDRNQNKQVANTLNKCQMERRTREQRNASINKSILTYPKSHQNNNNSVSSCLKNDYTTGTAENRKDLEQQFEHSKQQQGQNKSTFRSLSNSTDNQISRRSHNNSSQQSSVMDRSHSLSQQEGQNNMMINLNSHTSSTNNNIQSNEQLQDVLKNLASDKVYLKAVALFTTCYFYSIQQKEGEIKQ